MLSVALSLIAGLVVGIGYGLCGIRSPRSTSDRIAGAVRDVGGEHGTALVLRHFGDQRYGVAPVKRSRILPVTGHPKHREAEPWPAAPLAPMLKRTWLVAASRAVASDEAI